MTWTEIPPVKGRRISNQRRTQRQELKWKENTTGPRKYATVATNRSMMQAISEGTSKSAHQAFLDATML